MMHIMRRPRELAEDAQVTALGHNALCICNPYHVKDWLPACQNMHAAHAPSGAGLAHVSDQPAPAVAHAQVVHKERDAPVCARRGALAAPHGDRLRLPPLRWQRRSAQHRLRDSKPWALFCSMPLKGRLQF